MTFRRRWFPKPRPQAPRPTSGRIPMLDPAADEAEKRRQILALKRWSLANGIPYFGPQDAKDAPGASTDPGVASERTPEPERDPERS